MAKDPAALFYIDKWLITTAEMSGHCRGWFLNLILHQFDKGDLPNDIEDLASLANVKMSEFDLFKQVFEQVLKQMFKQNDRGRLENDFAKEIIQKRKKFVEKRSNSGTIGYIVKVARAEFQADAMQIEFIKKNINLKNTDIKNKQVLKQVLEHLLKLYINKNKDIDIDTISNGVKYFSFDELKKELNNSQQWLQQIAMRFNLPNVNPVKMALDDWLKDQNLKKKLDRPMDDIKIHFINRITQKPELLKLNVESEVTIN